MKTRFAVSAGGVVVRPAGDGWETLLASRRTRASQLVWGLAKGQLEEGESTEEAATREVGDAQDRAVIHMPPGRRDLRHGDAFVLGLVREHRPGDRIANP